MARIKIDLPEKIISVVNIPLRITDINYGNHLGNDALVGIIHEARVLWLHQMGYTEFDIEKKSIIMSDLAVKYLNESHYGDNLNISISIGEISSAGFEMYYHIETKRNEQLITIAKAKTGIVFYNYTEKKVCTIPETFKAKITW
ncbi:MAG: thioesterase family protein [Bacteroidota bacterium]